MAGFELSINGRFSGVHRGLCVRDIKVRACVAEKVNVLFHHAASTQASE
jgi:hypothetical protein